MDVKPANILFRRRLSWRQTFRQPVLIDFGIARAAGESSTAGTVGYMAPERHKHGGRQVAHPSMDIYALGVVLYEMLSGHSPTAQEPIPASQQRPRVWGREVVRGAFDPIIQRTMNPDRQVRPAAQSVLTDLERVTLRKPRRLWLVALIVLLLIGGVVYFTYGSGLQWIF
jgi:serine/threonine protein kinase